MVTLRSLIPRGNVSSPHLFCCLGAGRQCPAGEDVLLNLLGSQLVLSHPLLVSNLASKCEVSCLGSAIGAPRGKRHMPMNDVLSYKKPSFCSVPGTKFPGSKDLAPAVDLLKDVLGKASIIFLVTFSLMGTDDRKSNRCVYKGQ